MSKTWKWVVLTCPSCGKAQMPAIGALDEPDSMVSPYQCWECRHPELAEAERRMWEETDRKILEMAARGEIKDADGNPVPAIVVKA